MPEVKVIEFFKEKKLLGGIPLREDARSYHVLAEDGRHHKVAFDKVVMSTKAHVDSLTEESVLLPAIRSIIARREEIRREISLKDLWDLLQGDPLPRSPAEMAEIYFGGGLSDDDLSAMNRALLDNRVWFERRKDDYVPRAEDEVERTLHRIRVEEERARSREEFARYARSLYDGHDPAKPENAARLEEILRSYVLLEKESPTSREAEEILKTAGLSTTDAPFALLVRMKVFSPDENLLLNKIGLPREFPGNVSAEAEDLALRIMTDFEIFSAGRKDLRDLECFTIDSEATTEVDDALSLTVDEGRFIVGIHIADPTALINPESLLEEEIRRRSTAVYMPDLKIPMIPAVLGAGACSLSKGEERLALSIMVELDRDGNVLDSCLEDSVIVVKDRLTYEESLKLIEERHDMRMMYELATVLQRRRIDAGAAVLPFLRLDVCIDETGEVIIEPEDPTRPSQVLVSEMMILANAQAGDLCHRKSVPAIYRCQPSINEGAAVPGSYDPVALFNLRRHIRRASFSLEPCRHHGLGIDHYIQITSPIRRYLDFILHRQLRHFARTGAPFYTAEDLKGLLLMSEAVLDQVELLERDRRNYWVLKYLERRMGRKLSGTVLATSFDRAVVVLDECLLETEIPLAAGSTLVPGQSVQLRLDRVWPRDGVVRLSLA
jgi:exoribonuclease-2